MGKLGKAMEQPAKDLAKCVFTKGKNKFTQEALLKGPLMLTKISAKFGFRRMFSIGGMAKKAVSTVKGVASNVCQSQKSKMASACASLPPIKSAVSAISGEVKKWTAKAGFEVDPTSCLNAFVKTMCDKAASGACGALKRR